MKLLATVAVLSSLTAVAAAQTTIDAVNAPGTMAIQTPSSAPITAAPATPDIRPMGVTLELTGSSLGVGAEVGADLGYIGLVAGAAVTIFEDNRTYIMARAMLTARAFVGADLELSTTCIASEGDCDHTPFYAGLATGIAFH